MGTTMMRVREETRRALEEMAEQDRATMQDVLARAVENYRRRRLLEATNEAYSRLRADQAAWSELVAERRPWDATLMDGIEQPASEPGDLAY